MRSALVTLFCAFGLVVSGGTGTRVDDKADVDKEFKKFHGVWTFESVEAGGKKAPADELKGLVCGPSFGQVPATGTWQAHHGWISSVAFAPDGKTLASAGADGKVKLWRMPAAELQRTLGGHGDFVSCVAFAPDGRTVASGSYDRTARLWELATGRERLTLRGHRSVVTSVAFSPDGKTLATAGLDGTVKLWDAATGREQSTLRGHRSWVNAIAFHPDGQLLASGGSDGAVRLWNVRDGGGYRSLEVRAGEVRSLAFSADGSSLAAGLRYGTAAIWELGQKAAAPPRVLGGHVGDVWAVAFSPDGKKVVTGDGEGDKAGSVRVWDLATGKQQAYRLRRRTVLALAFTAKGDWLAAGSYDGSLSLWPRAQ